MIYDIIDAEIYIRGMIRMNDKKSSAIRNAIIIGSLCSVSYLIVYVARNILSAVTPQMLEEGICTTEYIGSLSSIYFICYAIGQLINGAIGDKIKAKYMMGLGLIFAGVCNIIFPYTAGTSAAAYIAYALMGFALSMIYGPMTKVVAENTEPVYTVRCSLGYEFGSLLGAPLAGVLAAVLVWKSVFYVGSAALFVMGAACLVIFTILEKKGIVKYNQYDLDKSDEMVDEKKSGVRLLLEHQIIKFTIISIITGVVRTTVIFWLPTYIAQYLGFAAETAVSIYTIATFAISLTAFIAVFIYEKLQQNMDLTILLSFISAAIMFALTFIVKMPVLNIILLVLAIMSSNSAATMLWSRYCPSLRDTGMVSSATGFLDFVSYMAASASSMIFANIVSQIGWGNLILIWFALMVVGILISLPRKGIKTL